MLPAKAYDVHAIHDGYSPSDSVHVEVGKGSQATVNLRLIPNPAILEIPTLSAGTQVKLDGVTLDSLPLKARGSRKIAAGSHVIDIFRQGYVTKRLERTVDPGKTLSLTSADLNLSQSVPDAAAREAEDWKRIKASSSLAELQNFEKRYPSGPHAQALFERIQELEWTGVDRTRAAAVTAYLAKYPQGSHSNEARQLMEQLAKSEKSRVEQSEWDSLNKGSTDALQSFIAKYPGGNHSNAARQLLAETVREAAEKEEQRDDDSWKSVDKGDRASIGEYLGRFPAGKHVAQAQQALANFSSRQLSQGDAGSVLAILQKFAAAWEARNIQAILSLQPTLNQRTLKTELAAVRAWRVSITPLASPQISGDHASITCRRKVYQTFSDGTERQSPEVTVTYTLRRQASSWVIEDVK